MSSILCNLKNIHFEKALEKGLDLLNGDNAIDPIYNSEANENESSELQFEA